MVSCVKVFIFHVTLSGKDLPVDAQILKFGSWMGGDRDGNPNVTSQVTNNVAYLTRWIAADLYLREVDALRFEVCQNVSGHNCFTNSFGIKHGILDVSFFLTILAILSLCAPNTPYVLKEIVHKWFCCISIRMKASFP